MPARLPLPHISCRRSCDHRVPICTILRRCSRRIGPLLREPASSGTAPRGRRLRRRVHVRHPADRKGAQAAVLEWSGWRRRASLRSVFSSAPLLRFAVSATPGRGKRPPWRQCPTRLRPSSSHRRSIPPPRLRPFMKSRPRRRQSRRCQSLCPSYNRPRRGKPRHRPSPRRNPLPRRQARRPCRARSRPCPNPNRRPRRPMPATRHGRRSAR